MTLIGAGPGDPELLTLKAVRLLQEADVVLYDDLVSPAVLEFSRDTAQRLHVGKRGYRASWGQAEIHCLMLKFARAGKHVVRLKSGDPLVFGRAGEEIAILRAAGIPVAVVPGITSGLALGAALSVSLTHRAAAQSVHFLTAHARDGGLAQGIVAAARSDARATLVIYMGRAKAAAIVAALRAGGRAGSCPAVAMAAISQPNERAWAGTLDGLAAGVRALGERDPVLIGAGEVFAGANGARLDEASRATLCLAS